MKSLNGWRDKLRLKEFIKNWLVPKGFWPLFSLCPSKIRSDEQIKSQYLKLVPHNRELYNRHKGERCFIICNGPSVAQQDLLLLKNEIVFSVSRGYRHPEYGKYQPRYHCVPQIVSDKMTQGDIIHWFDEMDEMTGDAEIILSTTEAELVRKAGLFKDRIVRYLCFIGHLDRSSHNKIIDISQPVPGVQSVAIMCLMVALYMGFKEIYMIGTEHDDFITGKYDYFFERTILKGKDMFVDSSGGLRISRYDQFQSLALLWRQYRVLKEIAKVNGIKIFNATKGGELDEFDRVDFEELFIKTKK